MVKIDEEIELLKLCKNDYEKEKVDLLVRLYSAASKESIMEVLLDRYEISLFNR